MSSAFPTGARGCREGNRPCAGPGSRVPLSHSSRGFCPWGATAHQTGDTLRLVSMPGESRPTPGTNSDYALPLISLPSPTPPFGHPRPPTGLGRHAGPPSIISKFQPPALSKCALLESTSHPLPPCRIEASCESGHRDRDRLDTSISDTDVRLILRAKSIFPRSCTAVTSTAQRRPRRIFNLKQLFRGHKTRSIY